MKKDGKFKKESKVKKNRSEGRKAGRSDWQQVRDTTFIVRTEKQIMAVTLFRLYPLVLFFYFEKVKTALCFLNAFLLLEAYFCWKVASVRPLVLLL
jgi:hypothetical protein